MTSVTRAGSRPPIALCSLALLCGALALAITLAVARPAAAANNSPLSAGTSLTTRPACSAPTPGHASCMAIEAAAASASARADSARSDGARVALQTPAECQAEFPSGCLTPLNLQSAYFPGQAPDIATGSPAQTIALIDAYNDPEAEADLSTYSTAFGLPPIHKCRAGESGCLEQVGQGGGGSLPFPQSEKIREEKETVCVTEKANETKLELKRREEACDELVEAEGWVVETSTDIEMAHAICQNCKILLVEASEPSYSDLEAAEETAVRLGATEISNSWGGPREGSSGRAFDHPGTVITAAAGDYGYLNWTEAEAAETNKETYYAGADYPASSPDVVAVGGTTLSMSDGIRQSETVWNEDPDPEGGNQGAGGGGCSEEPNSSPSWQRAVPDWSAVGCGSKRAVADVSADGDPYTGVAVYDSVPTIQEPKPGEVVNEPLDWWPIGGTSVASPIIGSMFALAGGSHGVAYPARTLYSHLGSSALHDITTGGNGNCDGKYTSCAGSLTSPLDCGIGAWICTATAGYDGPTGVGTPSGLGAFEADEEATAKTVPIQEPGTSGGGGTQNTETGPPNGGSITTGGTTSGGSTDTDKSKGGSGNQSGGARHTARITALLLTAKAHAALRRGGQFALAQVAFSCTLTQATRVRVTLSIRVSSGGRMRWRTLPVSLAFNAVRGVNRRRLHGRDDLAPGLYRLTLAPTGGAARSIEIRVN
jgi:hypothetical protein